MDTTLMPAHTLRKVFSFARRSSTTAERCADTQGQNYSWTMIMMDALPPQDTDLRRTCETASAWRGTPHP